jgi:hypothetical protein
MKREAFVFQTPDNAFETNESFRMLGLKVGTHYQFCDDWQELISRVFPGTRQLFIIPNRTDHNALVNAAMIRRINHDAVVIALTSNPTPSWTLSQLDALISKVGNSATAYELAAAVIRAFLKGAGRQELRELAVG